MSLVLAVILFACRFLVNLVAFWLTEIPVCSAPTGCLGDAVRPA